MSRIAEAYARAGRHLGEDPRSWEAVREVAARHLGEEADHRSTPNVQLPTPKAQPDVLDFELAVAMRRLFLAPGSALKSLMFCTVPGDATSVVAWQAAETLAAQSGQRVAFVEDPKHRIAPDGPVNPSIVQIDWSDAEDKAGNVLGDSVPDLLPRFSLVIVHAVASPVTDLAAMAREVDGVVLVIAAGATRCAVAKKLVSALRGMAPLAGAIFVAD